MKWGRRKPAIAGLLAAVFIAAFFGMAGILWQWRQAVDARREAAKKAVAEEQERQRADRALTKIELKQAEELFGADNSATALAHLANVLRREPANHTAANRIMSALSHRSFARPVGEPLKHNARINSIQFSIDGEHLVTASADRTACLWDFRRGKLLTEPIRHEGEVHYALFSPDSRRLVTASANKTARIWDALSGRPLSESFRHEAEVRYAQFSANGHGLITLEGSGSSFSEARDWSASKWAADNVATRTKSAPRYGDVLWTQPSPDGRQLLIESRLKNSNSNSEEDLHLQADSIPAWFSRGDRVWSPQFSPDAHKFIAIGFGNRSVRVFDHRTGTSEVEVTHEDQIYTAQFGPNGLSLITGSQDKTARIWDVETGKPLTPPLQHEDGVTFARFSPDGGRVVTVSWKCARVWDAQTGEPLTEPLRHDAWVAFAEFSPDGVWLATVLRDNTARVWDVREGRALTRSLAQDAPDMVSPRPREWAGADTAANKLKQLEVLLGLAPATNSYLRVHAPLGKSLKQQLFYYGRAHSVDLSADGRKAVTAMNGNGVRIWDVATGQPATAPLAHEDLVWSVQFSPDGATLLTTSEDKAARIWDASTGRLNLKLQQDTPVHVGWFSRDGQKVVTAARDKGIRVWDAHTGELLMGPLKHEEEVWCVQFDPGGRRLLSAAGDAAWIWDARQSRPGPLKHDAWVRSAEFSPDGAKVVTASEDGTARVWDANNGRLLFEPLRHDNWVRSARFSPDGGRIVTASEDRTVRIWDARTGRPLTEALKHSDYVVSAKFSRDGERIVTASYDHSARVWDARTGEPLTESLRHPNRVWTAEMSPDGRSVITACEDKTARIWELTVAPTPIAPWLPDLAEAVGGKRINDLHIPEAMLEREFSRLQRQIEQSSSEDYYTRWAKWFLADRGLRPISFSSNISVPDYVQRQIQQRTMASLSEARRLSPANGLILSLMAGRILEDNAFPKPRQLGEINWYSELGAELSPNSADVLWTRMEVLVRANRLNEALQTSEQAYRSAPRNAEFEIAKGLILKKLGIAH